MRKHKKTGPKPYVLNKEFILCNVTRKTYGCWEWNKTRVGGYGQVVVNYRKYAIHRLTMHLWKGFKLNSKMHVLHKCDNPPCCNPSHLFIGTQADNVRDAIKKGRLIFNNRGSNSGMAKLHETFIPDILALRKLGVPTGEIAKLYKVCRRTISDVCYGHRWNMEAK